MSKVLFINTAWDPADCSRRQAEAINKCSELWTSRHIRITPTFYNDYDVTANNYNRDEFVSLIEEADILHFCGGYVPEYKHLHEFNKKFDAKFNWGFEWYPMIKKKTKIFHDYCSWDNHWGTHSDSGKFIDMKDDIKYDAIFSSVPQASTFIYDCKYIPDVVNIDKYAPVNIEDSKVVISHFPTGGGNRKNTVEFKQGIADLPNDIVMNETGANRHEEIIDLKKQSTMGFDAIWRGFHGATTVENLAMGIPTMVGQDETFKFLFSKFFDTSVYPFEIVQTAAAIHNTIVTYNNNPDAFVARRKLVRRFMETRWNEKTISDAIVKEYEKL